MSGLILFTARCSSRCSSSRQLEPWSNSAANSGEWQRLGGQRRCCSSLRAEPRPCAGLAAAGSYILQTVAAKTADLRADPRCGTLCGAACFSTSSSGQLVTVQAGWRQRAHPRATACSSSRGQPLFQLQRQRWLQAAAAPKRQSHSKWRAAVPPPRQLQLCGRRAGGLASWSTSQCQPRLLQLPLRWLHCISAHHCSRRYSAHVAGVGLAGVQACSPHRTHTHTHPPRSC